MSLPKIPKLRLDSWCGNTGLRPATLLKKRLWHRCFPVNFAKFLRTPFLQNTSGGCFWILLFTFAKVRCGAIFISWYIFINRSKVLSDIYFHIWKGSYNLEEALLIIIKNRWIIWDSYYIRLNTSLSNLLFIYSFY